MLFLSACTPSNSAPPKPAGPLTAAEALGDLATVDFCSLLGTAGTNGSFGSCQVTADGTTTTVGSPAKDTEPTAKPYDYRGQLPAGVTVEQSSFDAKQSCTRYVVFADHVRLMVSAFDSGEGDAKPNCGKADAAVGAVLTAATGKRVTHVAYPENSLGRIDPCELLSGDAADTALGKGSTPSAFTVDKHSCLRSGVKVSFDRGKPETTGTKVTVAGKPATESRIAAFCFLRVERPAPGAEGKVESAAFEAVDTATGVADDRTCAEARKVAEFVLPKLPS
ncbi:hypothetical protein [Amycolatopsis sp. CA-230715]|uniref:hypothetical protein n=1 Tax=Amycolatopsis sp. CA-230715 TaxID=2745196 RepID=UPI001C028460|nr:hypothetical protein [Amycolatopsis sp. CA-230715]QWF79192.1 hypothetical protein HUW46_02599 [Amycolatopsis sp. CA-230715]